nr:RHS repeat-associated core domain-containing protein [Thioalkalivibrio sp. XN279]
MTRGFTGHEHLDQVGLIHMGGRVYDPEIGRFLSPDPFVQFPASTQGFNRYAYVGNNPLSYTDPSGYFLKKLMKVAGIGMNFVPGLQLPNAFLHGFVSGFLASEGNVKAGMMGMMSAGIAGEIGGIKDLSNFQRSALHGITQGAISAAGGGRFGDGALGAFSGSLLSFIPEAVAGPYGSGGEWAKIGRMTAAAVVGGTASALGGGKFANGAWSAAFVSRFNHDGSRWDTSVEQVPDSVSRHLEESHEVVGSFADTRHVPLMDSLGVGELPGVRLPGIRIGLGVVVTAANTLYFSDYEVTYRIHKTTVVEVTKTHTMLRSRSTGRVTYLGPIESRRIVSVSIHNVVSQTRYLGWSGVGRVAPSKITTPQCLAYGARC